MRVVTITAAGPWGTQCSDLQSLLDDIKRSHRRMRYAYTGGKPLFRRSVSHAAKAYMRASQPGVRYRTQYRAKMRYWKREESAKPTLWALEHLPAGEAQK